MYMYAHVYIATWSHSIKHISVTLYTHVHVHVHIHVHVRAYNTLIYVAEPMKSSGRFWVDESPSLLLSWHQLYFIQCTCMLSWQ